MEVQLPEFERNDEIKHIECGWNQSVLLTKSGSVWISEMAVKKQIKEKEIANNEEEGNQKNKKSKKPKKKDNVEVQEKEDKDNGKGTNNTNNTRWVDITQLCEKLK